MPGNSEKKRSWCFNPRCIGHTRRTIPLRGVELFRGRDNRGIPAQRVRGGRDTWRGCREPWMCCTGPRKRSWRSDAREQLWCFHEGTFGRTAQTVYSNPHQGYPRSGPGNIDRGSQVAGQNPGQVITGEPYPAVEQTIIAPPLRPAQVPACFHWE